MSIWFSLSLASTLITFCNSLPVPSLARRQFSRFFLSTKDTGWHLSYACCWWDIINTNSTPPQHKKYTNIVEYYRDLCDVLLNFHTASSGDGFFEWVINHIPFSKCWVVIANLEKSSPDEAGWKFSETSHYFTHVSLMSSRFLCWLFNVSMLR